MNKQEIIRLFMAAGYELADELVSQLTGKLKLVFVQEEFTAEIWVKGQSVEDVVRVIATYEYMRGSEEWEDVE